MNIFKTEIHAFYDRLNGDQLLAESLSCTLNINPMSLYVEFDADIDGYRLYQDCQGDPIECPSINDINEVSEWLSGTGLSVDSLIELVADYNIWD